MWYRGEPEGKVIFFRRAIMPFTGHLFITEMPKY